MPRKHRRRPEETAFDEERARRGAERVQSSADGEWLVRYITASGATKVYRCPGCDLEIRPGVAHVVAWPVDEQGGLEHRRHWHSGCWRAKDRRRPHPPRRRSARS